MSAAVAHVPSLLQTSDVHSACALHLRQTPVSKTVVVVAQSESCVDARHATHACDVESQRGVDDLCAAHSASSAAPLQPRHAPAEQIGIRSPHCADVAHIGVRSGGAPSGAATHVCVAGSQIGAAGSVHGLVAESHCGCGPTSPPHPESPTATNKAK